MAWYDDRTKTEFVGTYATDRQYQWDAAAAAKRGWSVQSVDDGSGHVIGEDPEEAKARQKSRITVTYVRDPDWIANREREIATAVQNEAAKAADNKEGRLVKADADLQKAEELFRQRAAATEGVEEAGREQAERELLAALRGIGPWSVELIAMRALVDPDAFPGGDLGIVRAARERGLTTGAELNTAAAGWRPWRSYATQYLWSLLDHPINRIPEAS